MASDSYVVSFNQPKEDQNQPRSTAGQDDAEVKENTWRTYKDSKFESPVLNRLIPFPWFYYCRWKVLRIFHARLVSGIVLGEVLFVLALIGGLANVMAAIGMGNEAAERTGAVAIVPPALAFAFACRNSIWVLFTGLPFERAITWHKLCAHLTVLVAAWHGYVSMEWDASGLTLICCFIALALFSFWPLRRKFFEAFYRIHWALISGVMVTAFIHGAGSIAFGAVLWLLDIVCRALIVFVNYKKRREILAVRMPSNIVRLTFLKENFEYKAGQYCFVCVPSISIWEWHPFSLSSSPHENIVSLHVRVLGDWTRSLYKYVEKTQAMTLYIDGPYGAPSLDLDSKRYKLFMFFSGGIGITPMQSICNDILYQRRCGRDVKKVMFIWSVRDLFMVKAVLESDKEYFKQFGNLQLPSSFSPDMVVHDDPNDILKTYFHLTREKDSSRFLEANIHPNIQPHLRFGRPNLPELFARMKRYAEQEGVCRVAVLTCGPATLIDNVQKLCAQNSSLCGGITFDFHKEVFEF